MSFYLLNFSFRLFIAFTNALFFMNIFKVFYYKHFSIYYKVT